ncbi:antibiotic biosynthesis monooxygenase family protein [Rubellimicrobium rubrum]|nr:antibiotic biosynthesis monooxygenase family protein [Rubellimicrobium rubrum]
MTTVLIDDDAPLLTVLVDIHLEPRKQSDFVAGVTAMIAEFTSQQPGFIASAIHASEDGTRVLNYSQWRDTATYERFRDHPEAQRRIAALQKLCTLMEARVMPPVALLEQAN